MKPPSGEEPAPTLVYAVLGAAGLFIISRLPLAAIIAGIIRALLALVRPALLILGVVQLWKWWGPEFPPDESSDSIENVERMVERGRQMGF